ncbi:MAG: alpha/beta hydrolase [Pseudomonadota bacterium]
MKTFLLFLLGAYGLYAITMVVLHPRFIYPFQPDDRVLPGFVRVELSGSDDVPVFVQERAGAGPIVLYFMGNVGALSFFEAAFEAHLAADRHVIAVEYRGGAGRPGAPSESVLKADALRAADYALGKQKPVLVQGFSLGTGLATYVAANRTVDRVILSAPYDSLCRLMAMRSWLPACLLPFVQNWRSFQDAERITAPMLVLHGSDDQLIPAHLSEAFATLPTTDRVVMSGAAHNNLTSFAAYQNAIDAFLAPLASSRE